MWKRMIQFPGVFMMTVSTAVPARAENVPFHEILMGDVTSVSFLLCRRI